MSDVDTLKERALRGVIGATLGDAGFDRVEDGYRALDDLCIRARELEKRDAAIAWVVDFCERNEDRHTGFRHIRRYLTGEP